MIKVTDIVSNPKRKKKPSSEGRKEIPALIPTITKTVEKGPPKIDIMVGKEIVEGRVIKNPLWRNIDDDGYQENKYDFAEFNKAEEIDAYIATTIRLTTEQCMKQGFSLTGSDPQLAKRVEKRLHQICEASSTTMYELVEQLIQGLTKFNNAFIVYTRRAPKRMTNPFQPFKLHGKEVNPIVGMHVVEPQHMHPVKKDGRIVKWKYYNQDIPADDKEFDVNDVFHVRWNRKADEVFGTPWLLPALDDVRMLRRLQEFVQMLISKHLFPIYQYKVGTEKLPAIEFENGNSEVKQVQGMVQDLPTQGCVFTSHRHEITAIDSNGALDIHKYVEYFDQLALSSTGLSGVDVGRGETSNKATAGVMNQSRAHRCNRIQKTLTEQFNKKVINDLLLSLGLDIFDEAYNVELKFAEVDSEEKRAHENHCVDMFNNGAITHNELRKECGRKPFSSAEEWDNTAGNTTARIGAQHGQDATINQTKEAAVIKQKVAPTNQSGTKPKPKTSKNS